MLEKDVPKIVDHEQRRAELAAAVSRVVGRGGVEAASVRSVAAEAGWSMGALRYYFSTQDELLMFAMDRMGQRIFDRVHGIYRGATESGSLERPTGMLCELLPLDDERRAEVLVWMAFMTRARIHDEYDEVRRAGWDGERAMCRLAVRDVLGLPLTGDLATPLPDPLEAEAAEVHVRIDGWTVQGATYPEHWPAADLEQAVRTALSEIRARHSSSEA